MTNIEPARQNAEPVIPLEDPIQLVPVVPPLDLNIFGTLAEPWLIKGCEREAEWTLEAIKQGLVKGNFLLWVLWDTQLKKCTGAFVTRVSKNTRGEVIAHDVIFAVERLPDALKRLKQCENVLRDWGVNKVRWAGRKGWERKLPDYKMIGVILEKVL